MNFQINLQHFPIVHNIPVQQLWIPPTLAVAGYMLPHVMRNIFPLHPDNGPLSRWRHQFALVYYSRTRYREPKLYKFIHVDVKDNLPLMLFCFSILGLKPGIQDFQNPKSLLALGVFIGCMTTTITRHILNRAFLELAKGSNRANLDRVSRLCDNISKVYRTK